MKMTHGLILNKHRLDSQVAEIGGPLSAHRRQLETDSAACGRQPLAARQDFAHRRESGSPVAGWRLCVAIGGWTAAIGGKPYNAIGG